ncbi:uncharacterized protein LOC126905539 isoform X2 [Daktulosphaira vitifoliae]|uniref:uncharacterized protein LOC126905539 isoform X2 n=1 Tax=Daktulosphaira vitifoliae TaxID=58002 RepID=UPI0021A9CECB|nr:uncharacterized protein LOC126905539 isoform X2 [Daktulosphaira vitifoliae]
MKIVNNYEKFNDESNSIWTDLFKLFKKNNEGIDYNTFKLFTNFLTWINPITESEIKQIFLDEVKDQKRLMNLGQFLKQIMKCVKLNESQIKSHYESFLNDEGKMTLIELCDAFQKLNLPFTYEDSNEIKTNFTIKDTQDISLKEFRIIYLLRVSKKYENKKMLIE